MWMGSGGSWQTTGGRPGRAEPQSQLTPHHSVQPAMVLPELLHQSCWAVANRSFQKHPNDTDVTSIPEMHISFYLFVYQKHRKCGTNPVHQRPVLRSWFNLTWICWSEPVGVIQNIRAGAKLYYDAGYQVDRSSRRVLSS